MTEPFRILVTGSRTFDDRPAMIRALSDASAMADDDQPLVLRHGGAKGADHIADCVWTDWHHIWPRWLKPEVYPAQWDVHGKKAGPLRNAKMIEDLEEGQRIDLALCFPLRRSIGTWDCIRKIEAAGIPWRNHGECAT